MELMEDLVVIDVMGSVSSLNYKAWEMGLNKKPIAQRLHTKTRLTE